MTMTAERSFKSREEGLVERAPADAVESIEALLSACIASEREIYVASEHITNRGLKLLVKQYAYHHREMIDQLRQALANIGNEAPTTDGAGGSLQRGWHDIQAVMTVQRESRQELVLQEAAEAEEKTLAAYERAMRANLPASLHELVKTQYEQVEEIYRWLKLMAGQQEEHLIVRLYERLPQAEQVVRELHKAGFAPSQVALVKLHESLWPPMVQDPQRRHVVRESIATNVISGFLFGAVFGLLLGIVANYYFPNYRGLIATTLTGRAIEAALIVGVIGAFWGVVFGWLMGRSTAEEDADMVAQIIEHGDALVVVVTDDTHRAQVEDIVGLINEREVAPLAA